MKIECDICQTIFLIDDSLISDKGIKAQCPRCGDQKVVRRPPPENMLGEPARPTGGLDAPLFTADAPAFSAHQFTAEGPAFGSPPSGSFGGTGNVSTYVQDSYGGGGSGGGNDFGFVGSADDLSAELTCFKCGKPIPESTDSVLPVCEECRGETAGYTPMESAHEDLPTTAGFGGPVDNYDLGLPPEEPYSPFGSTSSSAALSASPDFIPAGSLPPTGGGFGGSLGNGLGSMGSDLGHGFSADDQLPLGDLPMSTDDGRLDPTWIKIRRISDGQVVGPISLAEVRSLYVHGKLTMDDEYAGQDGIWFPIHQVPELMVILRRTPQLGSGGAAAPPSGGNQGIMLWVVAILLLGGGGATAWLIWANSNKASQGKTKRRVSTQAIPASRLFREKIKQWKSRFPSVKSDAKASSRLVKQGLAALANDQVDGYKSGADLFAKAVLARQKNLSALAGYCLATLWSPNRKQSSARHIGECASMLKDKVKTKSAALPQAVYALYRSRRGDNAAARRYARRAVKKARNSAFIQLIYGALLTNQKRTPMKAKRALLAAIKRNKDLARAHLIIARTAFARQRYARATASLKILATQVHPKGLLLLSELHLTMGYFKQAAASLQKLLDKHPTQLNAWLRLGILQYQLLGKRKAALKLLETPPTLGPGRELPRMLKRKRHLHLGYIALLNKDLKAVQPHAKALKQLSPNTSDTRFFQVQLLAAEGKYAAASKRMRGLLGRLSAPSYRTYQALLEARAGKLDDAVAEMRRLAQENSSFIWPRLALPALLCAQKKNNAALIELKKATDVEPDYLKYRRKPTDYYMLSTEWSKLKSYFLRTKSSREERSLFKAAAGLVAYHVGRSGEAASLLRSARSIDRNGLSSNLYLAQIYLERGSIGSARSYAKRVYRNYDENPTAALILANAAYRKKQYTKALALYRLVRRERPWYISAKVGVANVLIHKGQKKAAQDILNKLLASQHQHHLMARALQKLEY